LLHRWTKDREAPLGPNSEPRAENLKGWTVYRLRTNYRNTRSITAGCSHAIGEAIRSSSFAPQGEEPRVVLTETPEQTRALCEETLRQYLGREGMSASRVAILSTKSRKKSCLGEGPVGGYALTDDLLEWQSGRAVWFSTVKAFKGLEADVLILIEAGDFHPTFFSRQDLYVAASRAKHRLMVVISSKEVVRTLEAAASAGAG
jgi:superfamily I DNA/RNA helicase